MEGRSWSPAVALLGNRAAGHPPKEEEDEDHADQRTEDAAPIEYVLIADPEDAGEDEPADRGSDQAEHDRNQPGLWPFQVLEYVVGDECPADEAGHQSEKQCSDQLDTSYEGDPARYPLRQAVTRTLLATVLALRSGVARSTFACDIAYP